MIGALKAEYLKLATVRLWWILLIILVAYVGFTAALLAGLFGSLGDQLASTPGAPQLPDDALPPLIYSTTTAVGYVFPLIFGTLAVTSEFRYQTLTPTFLATPKRAVVFASKIIVLALGGALFGVVGLIASIGFGAPTLALTGTDPQLDIGDTWLLAARVILAMTLWAVIGVGIGTLVPNQIASIVIVLAFTQFVEPVLRFGTSIWEWTAAIGKFLPGAATDALVGSSIFTSLGATTTAVESLEWWQGGLVLLGLGALFSVAGLATSWRRDVT